MIEKKLVTVIDDETQEESTKEVYVEITTQEQEITIDMIDSSITQINSTIANLELDKQNLLKKKADMLAL